MIFVKSIRGRLLLWSFFSMTILFIISGFGLHKKLKEVILDSVDRSIHSNIQLVKGMVHSHDGKEVEYEVEEMIHGGYIVPRSGHYYKFYVDGKLQTASFSLVDWDFNLIQGLHDAYDEKAQEWFYLSVGPADEPLRVIRHDFVFMEREISIHVAESLIESFAVVNRLTKYCLVIMPIMTLLIGVVSLMIASVSLRPLQIFSTALEKITPRTLHDRIEKRNQAKELQGLAERFNALLARLEKAFEAEKHLIADAAHELKTPLAVIMAECDISMQQTRSSKEYTESLKEIRFVAEAMLRQINGMLTLARLDSGMLSVSTFQNISLKSCIENAVCLVEPLAKKENITINKKLGKEIIVQGNQDTLTEAILNIIENAVKYNHTGGSVNIAMHGMGRLAEIAIRDTGIGIDPAEQKRIIDRFYRSKAARSMEGTGLGLSIARAIIQAHCGDIEVTTAPSEGSCFILRIPVQDVVC
ncbi:MAG: sensor histidine kinase [Candidatus Electrothrix sp. AR3]|nr:sensor histidine kinase [Candidatus Electrothrix sp. AR3]